MGSPRLGRSQVCYGRKEGSEDISASPCTWAKGVEGGGTGIVPRGGVREEVYFIIGIGNSLPGLH